MVSQFPTPTEGQRLEVSPDCRAASKGEPQGLDHGPLVTSCISQESSSNFPKSLKPDSLKLYPVSLRITRPGSGNQNQEPPTKTAINSFSSHSRRRLRFRALNAFPALISQFGLTYHNQWPTDGRTCKKHLNTWLTYLRENIPGVGYLWLLEFQSRGAPHYHVFLTVPPDEETRVKLAAAWCRITSPGDSEALRFHQHARNWIGWDMGSGSYLCKYLDKEAQKFVPEGYSGFGRFWGNSRGLEAKPLEIPLTDVDGLGHVDRSTGEYYGDSVTVIRWLGRLAEKQTRGHSRFRARAGRGSYTMLQGSAAYQQIERYFSRLKDKIPPRLPTPTNGDPHP